MGIEKGEKRIMALKLKKITLKRSKMISVILTLVIAISTFIIMYVNYKY